MSLYSVAVRAVEAPILSAFRIVAKNVPQPHKPENGLPPISTKKRNMFRG
jgi:hypothetical protein